MIMQNVKGATVPQVNNETVPGNIRSLFTGGEKWAGLGVRVVSAIVLAALVLGVLYAGGFLFALIIFLAALQMLREWDALTINESSLWGVAGLFYVAVPCSSILWLRYIRVEGYEYAGLQLVLYILFVVWATDIGAFFTGRIVGGPKLAPAISPGKTWAGLGGGMAASAIVGGLCYIFSPYPTKLWWAILLAIILSGLAQGGDLFESWLKRRAGVKDSSTLIPGHGGLLDRVDGLMFTIPIFAFLVSISSLIRY
jgi:phosphatidate cytidylyltransferase